MCSERCRPATFGARLTDGALSATAVDQHATACPKARSASLVPALSVPRTRAPRTSTIVNSAARSNCRSWPNCATAGKAEDSHPKTSERGTRLVVALLWDTFGVPVPPVVHPFS
jgi:hypothetical protein